MIFLDSLPYKLGTPFEEINIDLILKKKYSDGYSIYISDRYSEVYLFGKVFESICRLFFSNNILTTIDYRFNNRYYTLFKESFDEYLPTDKKLSQDPFLENPQLYSYYEKTAISLVELNEDFFLLRLSDKPSLPRIKPNSQTSSYSLIKKQKYKSATEELLQYKETIIGVEIYAQWLEKHQQLYNTTHPTSTDGIFELIKKSLDKRGKAEDSNSEEPVSESDSFYWMYRHIKEVYEDYYLPKHKDAKNAVEEYNELNLANENDLLKWLVTYEEIQNGLVFFIDLYLEDDDAEFFEIHNVRLKTSDFEYIIKLCYLFVEHYYDMLKKYTTSKDGDLYDFEQKLIQSVREKHILDSKNKYLNYLQQYEKFFRNKPEIKDEEEFVKYLKNTNNDDFLHKYIKEYCEEEFKQHNKEYNEMLRKSSSLTYHLKTRGII